MWGGGRGESWNHWNPSAENIILMEFIRSGSVNVRTRHFIPSRNGIQNETRHSKINSDVIESNNIECSKEEISEYKS